ncbi:MAG: type II toxin-antitoxin system RelE family toxin [Aeromonas sp.]
MSLAWQIELSTSAKKQLSKIDKAQAQRIIKHLRRIVMLENPRDVGKALAGNLRTYWRYRVGDYRIICDISDGEMVILALEIGHRNVIYRE